MLGYRNDLHHIPILREYVAHVLKKSPSTTTRAIVDHHVPHVGERGDPSDDTYTQISCVYGVTRAEIDEIVRLICSVELPTLLDHPLIRTLVFSEDW